jgi:hypothetical protein
MRGMRGRRGRCPMTRGDVAGLAAGICLSASLSGACEALTTMPSFVLFATGVMLACCTMSSCKKAPALPCIALGIVSGLLLPSAPPPIAGAVVTHGAGIALRGDLFDVLDRLDDDPSGVVDRLVSVSGEWSPATAQRPATVSRRIMSCCAADAIAIGFDVRLARERRIRSGSWVRVQGVVHERMDDGDIRFVLEHSKVTSLEDTASNLD